MAQSNLKVIGASVIVFFSTNIWAKDVKPELIEVPTGTFLSIELVDPIHTGKNKVGDEFRARMLEGIWVKNRTVIAPGISVRGVLTEVQRSGRVSKRAKLSLTLSSLYIDGSTIPVRTEILSYQGDKHAGKNAGSLLGGALQGAFFGLLFGGTKGAGVGAGAGAGVGAVTGLIKGKQDIEFLQGARLLIEMSEPITVPVYPKPAKEKTDKPEAQEETVKPSS